MQAPKAKSATQNTLMGKVKSSPFKAVKTTETPAKTSNLPFLGALVLFGISMLFFLRARQPDVRTGPLVVLTQSAAPDQSTIDNLTASINAIAGQVHSPAATPTGGTSTPITVN